MSFVLKSFVTKYPSGKTRRRMKRMKLEKLGLVQRDINKYWGRTRTNMEVIVL